MGRYLWSHPRKNIDYCEPMPIWHRLIFVQADTCPDTMLSQMEQLTDRGFPTDTIEDYKNLGGTPWLDFKHSVFGQVYEGMNVVDDIANVRCGAGDRPMYDVTIEGIDILEI